uniref:Dof zinc finger protein n=1 Tax=Ananas comosus var. bracteatus TaxID=296719 RepID=A0A6V7Q9I2_ANACO|nr:unnamed protein product [Ananas comosus var. bracteatus]
MKQMFGFRGAASSPATPGATGDPRNPSRTPLPSEVAPWRSAPRSRFIFVFLYYGLHHALRPRAWQLRPAALPGLARWLAKIPQPEPALKCPRCDSTNTKFCYFNNYSISQPLYFCKTCRRYWIRATPQRGAAAAGARDPRRPRGEPRVRGGRVPELQHQASDPPAPAAVPPIPPRRAVPPLFLCNFAAGDDFEARRQR